MFTQVVELARSVGMGKLGHVAIDSTRIAANAAADSVETEEKLRGERAKIRKQIRRWQRQCEAEDPQEGAGTQVAWEALKELEKKLGEIPGRLERLKKSGLKKLSRTDADSRFFSQENLRAMEERGIDAYVPDSHLAHELNWGRRVRSHGAADETKAAFGGRAGKLC